MLPTELKELILGYLDLIELTEEIEALKTPPSLKSDVLRPAHCFIDSRFNVALMHWSMRAAFGHLSAEELMASCKKLQRRVLGWNMPRLPNWLLYKWSKRIDAKLSRWACDPDVRLVYHTFLFTQLRQSEASFRTAHRWLKKVFYGYEGPDQFPEYVIAMFRRGLRPEDTYNGIPLDWWLYAPPAWGGIDDEDRELSEAFYDSIGSVL